MKIIIELDMKEQDYLDAVYDAANSHKKTVALHNHALAVECLGRTPATSMEIMRMRDGDEPSPGWRLVYVKTDETP